MDFSFSEEQTLLKNALQNYLRDAYDFETRRKAVQTSEGFREEVWKQFAELGILALPFGEKHQGLDSAHVETMIVMEEMGRHLVTEPYVPSVILAGSVLRHAASEAQKEALIPPLARGEERYALAWTEKQSRFDLFDVQTTAKKDGKEYKIQGHKAAVPGGGLADKIIFTARLSGDSRARDGLAFFVADKSAKGLEIADYPAVDGSRGAEIVFDTLTLPAESLLGDPSQTADILETLRAEAIAALSSEAAGCMLALHAATMEFAKTRKQFGQPIGKFQVLQHRMVDMLIHCQESVSMSYMATLTLNAPRAERDKAASAAKAQIGKSGRFVGQQAVQLHGGMGLSDELNIGHYLKRLTVIDALFGNMDYHLRRYADAA